MSDAVPPTPTETATGPERFRLAMSPLARGARVALLSAIGLVFVLIAVGEGADPLWRAFAVVGVISSVVALRIVVGAAVVVTDAGLRTYRAWPLRRELAWYRILEVEVVPVAWVLEVELNNGQRFELPAVERLNELYAAIEERRHALDA